MDATAMPIMTQQPVMPTFGDRNSFDLSGAMQMLSQTMMPQQNGYTLTPFSGTGGVRISGFGDPGVDIGTTLPGAGGGGQNADPTGGGGATGGTTGDTGGQTGGSGGFVPPPPPTGGSMPQIDFSQGPMGAFMASLLGGTAFSPQGAFGAGLDWSQNPFASALAQQSYGQADLSALANQLNANTTNAMNSLRGTLPSVFNSGAGWAAGNVLQRLNADAGAQMADATLRAGQNRIQAALGGAQLYNDTGRAMTERVLGTGQFGQGMTGLGLQQQLGMGQLAQNQQQFESNYGLQSQQQRWMQTVAPALQMLLAALAQATPTGYQTVVGPKA